MKNMVVLSLMIFLEFMMYPVWFLPMFPYVQTLPGGADWAFWCGLLSGIGALASPIVGMFADRYVNAERMLFLCYLASGLMLVAAFFATTAAVLFWILLGALVFYMPTWSLSITILLQHAPRRHFAWMRSLGTAGWVAASGFSVVAAACGFGTFDSSPWIFVAGAATSAAGALVALFLPKTEPKAKGTPMSIADAFGLRALVLFRDRSFRSIVLVFLFATIPYQWYYVYCSPYLKDVLGFRFLTLPQSLGQVSEVGFILVIPWILTRFGYRKALLIAFAAVVFRYACFAASAFTLTSWGAFAGIAIHGLVFGLISLGAQIYANDAAPAELRNQAQGLINVLMTGCGAFLSNTVFDAVLRSRPLVGPSAWSTAYVLAVALAVAGIVLTLAFVNKEKEIRK